MKHKNEKSISLILLMKGGSATTFIIKARLQYKLRTVNDIHRWLMITNPRGLGDKGRLEVSRALQKFGLPPLNSGADAQRQRADVYRWPEE